MWVTAVVLSLATLSACSVVTPGNTNSGNFELLILHNNDMHARFEQTSQLSGACTIADREAGKCYGGFPRVAHVVKEARKAAQNGEGPPVLYLNAGDTYTGTAWFTIYKWKIAAEFINAIQPDAVSLGNHEFDDGVSGLTPFIENISCPVVCANLVLTKVPELTREKNLKNSIIIPVRGHRIGIIGYLTPTTKVVARPNDVEYIDEIVALNKEVKNLQDQGVKIIIALGHSGYLRDQDIAREVKGLDLVIGGHTNTFLWNGTTPDSEYAEGPYPTYVTQASGKKVPVVQAYAYTKYLGKLHLNFDDNGEIIDLSGKPLLLDQSIPQDPDVLGLLKKYNSEILLTTDVIVGNTSILLSSKTCEKEECNLGNLITDAMVQRYASDYKDSHWTDAPIAILQAGGIRTSIAHPKKPFYITKGDLLSVMPFNGNLTTVKMTGSILLEALEASAAAYNTDLKSKFLQFSGLKVVYNMENPIGSRVISVKVRCWACQVPSFTDINVKGIYKVIMPSFLANGGDGFSMMIAQETQPLGYSELDCTEYYVKHYSPVFAQLEGRIKFVNQHLSSSSARIIISVPILLFLTKVSVFI